MAKWISPAGRIGRGEYWRYYALPVVLSAASATVPKLDPARAVLDTIWETFGWGIGLTLLAILLIGSVKRARDLRLPKLGLIGCAIGCLGATVAMAAMVTLAFAGLVLMAVGTVFTNPGGSPPRVGDPTSAYALIFALPIAVSMLVLGSVPGISSQARRERLGHAYGPTVRRQFLGVVGVVVAYSGVVFVADSEPALIQAVKLGNVQAVRALLVLGADPEKKSRRSGDTALWLAVARSGRMDSTKFKEIAAALVENGADASGRPLMAMVGVGVGSLEMVELMLAHGANVNTGASESFYEDLGVVTPLSLAVHNLFEARRRRWDASLSVNVELVKLLMDHGANDPDALAQLRNASRRGWTTATELLARVGLTVESGQSTTPTRE